MNSQITALLVSAISVFAWDLFGQANGKLQLHFMNVGQGDGALLISPQGEVVLFDNGLEGKCDRPLSYLDQLGVTNVDYHITSHYHRDHFGCTAEVLSRFPLRKAAYDRGESYSSPQYTKYVGAVDGFRRTAIPGTKLDLDAGSGNPVRIEFVASNAKRHLLKRRERQEPGVRRAVRTV